MEDNKAVFKGKTGGGRGTNQYQVKGSGKQKQTGGNGKTVSCKWLTMKDGRKLCLGSDGNYYAPKSAQGQAQADKEKAIEAGLKNKITPDSKSKWKPFGTESEAEDFAKNSKIKTTLFHGTTETAKIGIEESGFDLSKNAIGRNLGNGVYLTEIQRDADWYSKLASSDRKTGKIANTPAIVKAKVNVSNPIYLTDEKFNVLRENVAKKNNFELYTTGGSMIDSAWDKAAKLVFDGLEKQGYDSMHFKGTFADSDTYVIFNPKSIMTFR